MGKNASFSEGLRKTWGGAVDMVGGIATVRASGKRSLLTQEQRVNMLERGVEKMEKGFADTFWNGPKEVALAARDAVLGKPSGP